MTIKEYLKSEKMTMKEGAEQLGVSLSTLYRIIAKTHTPTLDICKQIVVRSKNKIDFWDL